MDTSGPVSHGGDATERAPVKVAGRTHAAGTLPAAQEGGRVADLLLDEYGRIRAVTA